LEDSIRKLASIQTIKALDPIPNADRIEVATILGWHVVVKKGEFEVGDPCIYFEVDSVLPKKLCFEFLIDKNRPDKPIRLKTIRLRKQISQGLALPVTTVMGSYPDVAFPMSEGADFTEILGVTKYDPPLPAELAGKVRGNFPSFLKKTDTHRVQSHPRAIQELIDCGEVYVTIKYDGTSSTFYNLLQDPKAEGQPERFGVCSRNMDLTESDTNTYWKMAHKYCLPEILKGSNVGVQGETHGMGIQANKLGLSDVQLAVFDKFDITSYAYSDLDNLIEFCDSNGLTMVKVIYRGPMKWYTVDELIAFADEQKYDNGHQAEGIIVRPTVETYSESLQGRLAIKAISPKYLLKG